MIYVCTIMHQHFCNPSGVLIANKVDLDTRRVISPKKGQELANNNKLEYFECSAVRIDHSLSDLLTMHIIAIQIFV